MLLTIFHCSLPLMLNNVPDMLCRLSKGGSFFHIHPANALIYKLKALFKKSNHFPLLFWPRWEMGTIYVSHTALDNCKLHKPWLHRWGDLSWNLSKHLFVIFDLRYKILFENIHDDLFFQTHLSYLQTQCFETEFSLQLSNTQLWNDIVKE